MTAGQPPREHRASPGARECVDGDARAPRARTCGTGQPPGGKLGDARSRRAAAIRKGRRGGRDSRCVPRSCLGRLGQERRRQLLFHPQWSARRRRARRPPRLWITRVLERGVRSTRARSHGGRCPPLDREHPSPACLSRGTASLWWFAGEPDGPSELPGQPSQAAPSPGCMGRCAFTTRSRRLRV